MRMPKVTIPKSGRIECRVHIKPYDANLMKSIRFKVDTGADFSTISKSALYELGYADDWIEYNKQASTGTTTSASGETLESYFVRLPIINIFGIEGVDYPFGILLDKEENLPKPSCRGCEYTTGKKLDFRSLLGNDILTCFNISINRESNSAVFLPQKSLDERNKIYSDRQLNFIETKN